MQGIKSVCLESARGVGLGVRGVCDDFTKCVLSSHIPVKKHTQQ